jgi:hypothetical protein
MHWALMKSSTLKHNRLLANSKRFSVTDSFLKSVWSVALQIALMHWYIPYHSICKLGILQV